MADLYRSAFFIKGDIMKSLGFKQVLIGSTLLTIASCGGPTGHTGPTVQEFTSPNVTVNAFVDALNNVDPSNAQSFVELYTDETFRSAEPGEESFFVIWDDKFGEYKAFSLQYIRAIVYFDVVRDTNSLASEFRAIEGEDILDGNINGDFYGDDYEVVDYDSFTDSFWGRNSGFEYEDEDETTDVNLMAAEAEQMKFIQKAAAVSYEFQVSMSKAMSLVTLGAKVEMMQKDGSISAEDLSVITKDAEKVSGVSMADLFSMSKEDVLKKASKELGSTPASIEQKLLPGLFGINL